MENEHPASEAAREALARAEKATAGPWYHIKRIERRGAGTLKRASIKSSGETLEKYPHVHRRVICEETWYGLPREDDLEFIAWAREGVPKLARALQEAQGIITRQQRKIASLEREKERLWKLINAAEKEQR